MPLNHPCLLLSAASSCAGLWSIVDINYFPSYLGIQDADGLLHTALVDCAACRDSLNESRDRP